jgi:hypothetical protein
MAEHGLAQQGGRFNILYAEHRTEKTIRYVFGIPNPKSLKPELGFGIGFCKSRGIGIGIPPGFSYF